MTKRYSSTFSLVLLKATLLLALLLNVRHAVGQDQHFTQYYNAPQTYNPALTGVFDGVFRATNNYRSQWASSGDGYKTMQVSLDAPLGKASLDNRYFGAGLLISQDKAGLAGFKRTQIEGSLSYSVSLNHEASHWISIGFQGGLDNQVVDPSAATWDSQWNGDSYDPSLSSNELIQYPNLTYFNLNAGANYMYCPDGYNFASAGVSLSHIGSPNVSFYPIEAKEDPYRQRVTIHGNGEIELGDFHESFINPRIFMQFQAKHHELVVGGYYKQLIRIKSLYTGYMKQSFVNLGAFYRLNESFILATRFDYHNFNLGLSYDLGIGKLGQMISANSWEVSVGFVAPVPHGSRARNFNRMPRYL
ncbi:MAG: hypothetical protein RL213_1973 [Bacteroidota bacterium]|jgi:type IX secretion system PorP/SprF family membrane protein